MVRRGIVAYRCVVQRRLATSRASGNCNIGFAKRRLLMPSHIIDVNQRINSYNSRLTHGKITSTIQHVCHPPVCPTLIVIKF
jgi:hypothetical protein